MLQLEFLSPEARYVVERQTRLSHELAVLTGIRCHKRQVDVVVARCVALGMEAVWTKHHVLITPGTCDVDGPWSRARQGTRDDMMHRQRSAASYVLHEGYRRARVAEAAHRRAEREATAADLADLVL